MEIMNAIGMHDQQHLHAQLLDEERPATMKSKKSFMQKLSERHGALKLQMAASRSPKVDDDDATPSRTSSSSSASKDFFKMATTTTITTKSERPIAMRYDDIADDSQPTPVFVQSPITPSSDSSPEKERAHDNSALARTQRQCRRESSVMEMNATHRLYTSHSMSSMASSPRKSVLFAPPLKARAKSLPSQMTDAQMDAWLDMPEDAETHRLRKAERNRQRAVRRKPVVRVDSALGHVVFKRDDPFSYDVLEARREIERMFAPDAEADADVKVEESAKTDVTFASLPVEVVLQVARYLDTKSTARCRQTCRKMYETLPAPLLPLVAKKT